VRNTKLFIGSKIEQPRNIYLLDIKLMHGDADVYTHLELKFKDVEKNELIATIDVLSQLIPWDYERYHKIQGFSELLSDDWNSDVTCDEFLASYDRHELYYFNQDGEKFNVKVVN
jgi:hypothetical protein